MSKLKVARHSPHIDMTPMVDLFSLLLTFFMLTTSFRPQEAAQIDTPSSISEKTAPDVNVMTVLIANDGRVFFNIDNGKDTTTKFRAKVLAEMGKQYGVTFTPAEIDKFSKLGSFGTNFKKMRGWINAENSTERDAKYSEGIPMDSLDNQFAWWIHYTRLMNTEVQCAVKADGKTPYKVIKKVLQTLQEKNVNRYALTTNLEKVEIKLEN